MSSSLVGHDPVPPSDNSNPRSILHFRGDDLLEDYGEGASTSALYGEKLQEAIDAMQAGDRLQCAGGGEAASDTLSISCSDCSLDFNGLRVVPITSQWNYLVQVPGEANKISGLVVDAKNIQSTVGTHYPIGLRVTGASNVLDGCEVHNVEQSAQATGSDAEASGEGLDIRGKHTTLRNFYATGCDYAAIVTHADFVDIENARLTNNRRGFVVRTYSVSSVWQDLESVSLKNVHVYVNESGNGPEYNNAEGNVNPGGTGSVGQIRHFRMKDCTFKNENVLAGVNGRQLSFKVQNVDQAVIEGCTFDPGFNQWPEQVNDFSISVAMESTREPKNIIFRDCGFARGGVAMGENGGAMESFAMENCEIGTDLSTVTLQIYDIGCPLVRFSDCTFHLKGDNVRPFNFFEKFEYNSGTSSWDATGDRQDVEKFIVERCSFKSYSSNATYTIEGKEITEPSSQYLVYGQQIANVNANPDIACRFVFVDNTLESAGGGTVSFTKTYPSGTAPDSVSNPTYPYGASQVYIENSAADLMLSTDSAGNILFDDSNSRHLFIYGDGPDGSGVYFPDLPCAVGGMVIKNKNWRASGTAVVSEKSWIYHQGIGWKEYY